MISKDTYRNIQQSLARLEEVVRRYTILITKNPDYKDLLEFVGEKSKSLLEETRTIMANHLALGNYIAPHLAQIVVTEETVQRDLVKTHCLNDRLGD